MLRAIIASTLVLAAFAVLITSAGPAAAGDIDGFLYTPFKSVQSAVSVSATRDGNFYPAGFGWGNTFESYPVGWYGIYGLAPGSYQLLFHEKDHWARFIKVGISVPPTGLVHYDRRIEYPNYVTGLAWMDGSRHNEWAQSFVATGTSLTMVALHQAIEFGPDTTISVHQGTPDGPQIGPSKTIPTNVVNPTAAFWSHGEVPLTPGQTYCVKFRSLDPGLCFLGAGRIQGGKAYPDGRTWRAGAPIDDPIKMTLCQDDDGLYTIVNTRKKRSDVPTLSYASVTSVGQTFVAKGTSLMSASCLVGSTGGQKLNVTVHDGPGTAGEGGLVVGYGKNIKPVDWNWYSGAAWKPGEVPLEEGHTYYLKITRADGQPFTIYYVNENEYQGGQLYLGSNAIPGAELSTTITAEAFSGSLSRQRVQISNIQVARATNSATISWQTDVATSTNYAEYAKTNPYQFTVSDPAGGTSHSVTITGLAPNTLYHYRVVSKAAGYWDGISRDFVFVTEPDTTNLIVNPGFETGSIGPWVAFGGGDIGVRTGYPPGTYPDWFGATAHSGGAFFGGVCNGLKLQSGIYQRVPVTPGKQLNARAWFWTWQQDNLGAFMDYTCHAQIGIDPTGGTDVNSTNISWSPATVAQDLFGNGDGSYCEAWVQAAAGSEYATVFLYGGSSKATAWTIFAFDDIVMTESSPTPVSRIADLKSLADGTFVELPGKIVVATPLEMDAAYVEEPDRTAGLRVESSDYFMDGYEVTLVGAKGTKPSGEVYLYNATISSISPSTEPRTMTTLAKSIGNVGPGNVAMLMRVSGKISMDDFLVFYINDGSLPGLGLKLNISSLTYWPELDKNYSITGIVHLEGSSPNVTPVLYPRSDDDVQLNN